MKPDREGVWEWFEENGTKRLVCVFNTEPNPFLPQYLRVYWWCGYYNVNDEPDPDAPQYDWATKAEWPDRWGNYVGPIGSVKEEDLYMLPTDEELRKMLEK